jgi:putative transposase
MEIPEPPIPSDSESRNGARNWPHAPPHNLDSAGIYFLTSRAKDGKHLLEDDSMKDWFQETFFQLVEDFGWKLEAWAILSNHYHFIANIPPGPDGGHSVRKLVTKLHSFTTKELNRREGMSGRTRLWHNFREMRILHARSYLARLHYVHQNAVHHKLVDLGSDWKWCSAAAFKKEVSPAWLKTIASFRYDQIAEKDGE